MANFLPVVLLFASSFLTLAVSRPASDDFNSLEQRDSVPAGYIAAPYYPTPLGGWASEWGASYAKAAALVANMTLAEKVNLTAGTGLYMGQEEDVETLSTLLM